MRLSYHQNAKDKSGFQNQIQQLQLQQQQIVQQIQLIQRPVLTGEWSSRTSGVPSSWARQVSLKVFFHVNM